jgi:hypothetical protein
VIETIETDGATTAVAWSADREELAADIRDPWDNA